MKTHRSSRDYPSSSFNNFKVIYIISLSDITTASHQHYAYYEPINLILSITLYARIVKRQGYPLSPRRIWWWNVSKIHASWFTVSIAINTNWSIEMFIQVSLIGSRLRRYGSSGSEAHWKTRICFKSVWEKYHACWSYTPPSNKLQVPNCLLLLAQVNVKNRSMK